MRNLDWLYRNDNNMTPLDFYFDNLTAPSLYYLIPKNEIINIYNIIKDPRLSCDFKKKDKMVGEILTRYNFYKFHAGTNRNIYCNYDYPDILIKVAMDKKCLSDNIDEFNNQFKFKPFIPKVFETDPTGVIGLFERINPVKSREEFLLLAEDIFDMLISKFIGKYVLDDIGTRAFMNYGYRDGFGPVLLDFPYAYELDGNKLICSKVHHGNICNGIIDYDDGFNVLKCEKCGAEYTATELQSSVKENRIKIVKPKGDTEMIIQVRRGRKEIKTIDTSGEVSTYKKFNRKATKKKKNEGYDDGETFEIIFGGSGEKYNNINEVTTKVETAIPEEYYSEEHHSQQEEIIEKIPEEQIEVVKEVEEVDPFEGWKPEEINIYKEAKASLEAVQRGLNLTEEGYNKLQSYRLSYPFVIESLLIEFGIAEIPNPIIIESKAVEVVEKQEQTDIDVNSKSEEKKTPSQIAKEFKQSIKPKIVISPRQFPNVKEEKENNEENDKNKYIDENIDVEELY